MRFVRVLFVLFAPTIAAFGQTSHTSERANQILTQEVIISGTGTLDSQQLQDISNSLTSRRFRDDEHELKQRIQDAFQDMGYFDADVSNLKVRALDPLARPKPVRVEADVTEGPRYRFGAFGFSGNQAFSSAELSKALPVHVGDFFSTGKVRSGLTSMRDMYLQRGYLNFVPIPATETLASGQVKVIFDITEGPQFRMGSLEIAGKGDDLDQIQRQWPLRRGEMFDPAQVDKFVTETKQLLPEGFQQSRDLELSLNCTEATVQVRLDLDGNQTARTPLKDVGCEKEKQPALK